MNDFRKSVMNNEMEDFLLGKGEYYYHNRDWDTHDFSTTWFIVMEDAQSPGSDTFILLDRILIELVNKYRENVLSIIITYISSYLFYKYEYPKLDKEWRISEQLKDLIKELFRESRGLDSSSPDQVKLLKKHKII